MNVDHNELLKEWTSKDRSKPVEYYAIHIPDLCKKIEHLESVAKETGQLYKPINTELGGGIHFNYVSDSNVEEQFPRMFRLLLNKVRKDGDRKGFNRAEKYFEEYEIEPLKSRCDALISVLKTIASDEGLSREHMMNLADNTVKKMETLQSEN